jgi:hypothetical protein
MLRRGRHAALVVRTLGLAILFLSIGAASSASAQAGAVFSRDSGCLLLDDSCDEAADCTTAFPVASSCAEVQLEGGTELRCKPDRSVFCCGAGEVPVCPLGSTCHTDPALAEFGLCLPDDNDYCEDAPTALRVEKCHTSPEGAFPVPYLEGDCDADLVSNRAEMDSSTDHCVAPPDVVGVWIDEGAEISCATPVNTCPSTDNPCGEGLTCRRTERTGEGAPLCIAGADVFCCGGEGGAFCPALTCVTASDRPQAPGVCTSPEQLCGTTEASLRACHTSPAGTIPVPIEEGDCDGDGIANAVERERGTDPCAATERGMDAGVQPSFAGGGGARCAASISHRGGSLVLAAFAALVVVSRRRRARG